MKQLLGALLILSASVIAQASTITPGSNRFGDIVGTTYDFYPPDSLAFELDHHGLFSLIGPNFFGDAIRDTAIGVDINDNGAVTGLWQQFGIAEPVFQSFIYSGGVYDDIEFIPDPSITECIYDHETIVDSIANNGLVFGTFRAGDVTAPCDNPVFGSFAWLNGVFYNTGLPGSPTIPISEPASGLLVLSGLALVVIVLKPFGQHRPQGIA